MNGKDSKKMTRVGFFALLTILSLWLGAWVYSLLPARHWAEFPCLITAYLMICWWAILAVREALKS